ncbi:MAG: CinA family nicotinamide mononucleotide deamidase-related protein [Desulfobacterales bacterium]|nr:CinA family nicotinamide mononucleotide deamidase-related protein [Desulfobacterales bacterium]
MGNHPYAAHRNEAPTCEIITIGSELLLGQIVDTNTAYLAREMNKAGIIIRIRTAVGDRVDEMKEAIGAALKRSHLVITTGGLGPTLDDVTREAVSQVAGAGLEYRQGLMDEIEQMFRRYGYEMPDNNRRQAYVPAGSIAISNPVGTAPAFIKEIQGRPVICLPGVPRELKYLMTHEVIPWVRRRFDLAEHVITYHVLKVVGIGESGVDRLIGDLIRPGQNPEVGLLASQGEIKIRIAAVADGERGAQALIEPVETEIRSRLGNKIFGQGDDTLEGVIDSLLNKKDLTLALLETFTAGLAANRLFTAPSSRLLQSCVIPDQKRVAEYLCQGNVVLEESAAITAALKVKEKGRADVGLALLGFIEGKERNLVLKGCAAAAGDGIAKAFSWEMGGDLFTLQARGAVIGLNTLRLALL